MRLVRSTLLAVTVAAIVGGHALAREGGDERSAKEKKEQREKKGALKEEVDPAKDLKLQKENLKKLRHNAAESRKNGNRVAAWAAEADARHAEKLIKKDEKLLEEGKRKKEKVDDQKVDK